MRALFAVLVILLALLQGALWFGDGGLRDVWQLEAEVAQQSSENAQLKARNEALEAEVRDLKGGLEALEERARRELGMIKEGEMFYQVIEEQ